MAEMAPRLARRLTTQDASFLYAESQSGPLHISSLGLFESEVRLDALKRTIESRLHLMPRYRQRLSFAPLNLSHPTWEDDPSFKLEDHFSHHRLLEGASEAEMVKAATKINEQVLNRNRPLWEMHLFTGLKGGRSAVLTKVHHCMVDGVSGIHLLAITMDFQPDAPPPRPPEVLPVPPGHLRSTARESMGWAGSHPDVARRATEAGAAVLRLIERLRALPSAASTVVRVLARPIVRTPWNVGTVTSARSFAWLRVSFADMRQIKNAFGGTTNDAVLAILSEGAARYLKEHGIATYGLPLRIGCPVSVRRNSESESLGNQVSMMFPEFKSSPMEMSARLRAVKAETERIKSGGEAQALESLMSVLGLMPPSLMRLGSVLTASTADLLASLSPFAPWATRLFPLPPPGINFVATNVPGVQVPLYLAGHRMERFIGMVPLAANLGYGVAICSYNQDLCFALSAEPRLMPDVGRMKFYVKQSFEELRKAAQKITPLDRRAPVEPTAEPLRAAG